MKNDLIVVPDHAGRCGAITWWRLSGTLNYDALVAEWAAADLPSSELPSPPSDTDALKRALMPLRGPRTLIRTLPSGGYAVVDETFEDGEHGDPDYEVRFKVWIDYDVMEMKFEPAIDEGEVESITERFAASRRELDAVDLSSWLVRRAYKVDAVALRDTGGIYFVPEQRAADWSKFADIVHKLSGSRVYEIPALKTTRAVEAIMSAVIAETQAGVEALAKKLDAGELSERGLKAQAKRCEELADKLRTYESLLGVKIGDMHGVLTQVDGRITEMLLAEMAA